MPSPFTIRLFAVLALLACAASGQQSTTQAPYRGEEKQPLTYKGPGREDPEPKDLKSIAIGFFGPEGNGTSQSELIWQGAQLAVQQANQAGGYKGIPFRLVSIWAPNPWTAGAAKLIRAIYTDNLWAIIGGIDGSTTHLAEQVTTKVQIVLINPAATDRSIHAANVPWMFSCVPGDDKIALLISEQLKKDGKPFLLVSATDHDSRVFVTELKKAFDRDRLSPTLQVEFDPLSTDATRITQEIEKSASKAVVLIADRELSVRLIRSLRAGSFNGKIFTAPPTAATTSAAEFKEVLVPALGSISPEFSKTFSARFGHAPDYTAAHAYDAAKIITSAIRKHGLNRARILDGVRELSPYEGASGRIEWDSLGQNKTIPVLKPLNEAY